MQFIKIILALSLFTSLPILLAETPIEKTLRLMPKMVLGPPGLDLAIPDDYVVSAFPPYGDPEDPDLPSGVLWGPAEVVKEIWKFKEGQEIALSQGVFLAQISLQVGQKDLDSFTVSEQEFKEGLKKLGASRVECTTKKWGAYPVLAVKAIFPRKPPFCMAWIGLNYAGQTVEVKYIFSKKKSSHPEELALWDQFIEKTKPLEIQDCLKTAGIDYQPGRMTYERHGAKIFCDSECKDGKTVVSIGPITPQTSVEFMEILPIEEENEITSQLQDATHALTVNMDTSYHYNSSGKVVLPIAPIEVTEFTLDGETLFEDENVKVVKASSMKD